MNKGFSASIIVPAYNAEATIERCIQSILSLDPAPLEIIVVNDYSIDNTSKIACNLGVTVIDLEKNVGAAAARNMGVKIAKGEFVGFVDADCVLEPGWLGNCLKNWDGRKYSGLTGPYSKSEDLTELSLLTHQMMRFNQRKASGPVDSSKSANLFTTQSNFCEAGGFPVYTLPWSGKNYYVNEDAEFAFFLIKKTGKPLLWLYENGVSHFNRPTLRQLFIQQFIWTEAILLSYCRFPEMLKVGAHYSRRYATISVLTCLLLYSSLVFFGLGYSSKWLVGILPFFGANLTAAQYLNRHLFGFRLVTCYFYLLFVSTAWLIGLISGSIKGTIAYCWWTFTRNDYL